MIAIEPNRRLFYEGSANWGHAIWPSPVVTVATIFADDVDISNLPLSEDLGSAKFVFREDSFDPVTKIRRGRLYETANPSLQQWHVQTHPAYMREAGQDDLGNLIKLLFGFHPHRIFNQFRTNKHLMFALGVAGAYTLWKVIDVERVVTGEDMITLRARSSMGVLPEIAPAAFPEDAKKKATDVIDKVVDAAYRAGPESVIDRCRDAAQACLGMWMAHKFADPSVAKKDLGKLINQLESDKQERPEIIISSGKALARLHARCKPNEQLQRDTRLPMEDDAEAAIAMLGLLLRELGWASL